MDEKTPPMILEEIVRKYNNVMTEEEKDTINDVADKIGRISTNDIYLVLTHLMRRRRKAKKELLPRASVVDMVLDYIMQGKEYVEEHDDLY